MNFLAEVEDKFKLSRADKQKNIKDNFIRMSLIAGFHCRNLAVKALADKLNLKPTVQVFMTRENSRANAQAMEGKSNTEVKRLRGR